MGLQLGVWGAGRTQETESHRVLKSESVPKLGWDTYTHTYVIQVFMLSITKKEKNDFILLKQGPF